mmetsp:Transcript_8769/g.23832  ORF Transcript_8769/g.23832 Transcript_8769/m.23832 type:complete len:219 (+) Transcript_8769:176-832(+)
MLVLLDRVFPQPGLLASHPHGPQSLHAEVIDRLLRRHSREGQSLVCRYAGHQWGARGASTERLRNILRLSQVGGEGHLQIAVLSLLALLYHQNRRSAGGTLLRLSPEQPYPTAIELVLATAQPSEEQAGREGPIKGGQLRRQCGIDVVIGIRLVMYCLNQPFRGGRERSRGHRGRRGTRWRRRGGLRGWRLHWLVAARSTGDGGEGAAAKQVCYRRHP